MTGEEAQKVLDELNTVRIEVLNDEAKRLFEAIITIADERDKIKQEYDRDTHILQNRLDLVNAENIKKDKQIEQYQNMLVTNDLLHIKESQEKDKQYDINQKWIKKVKDKIEELNSRIEKYREYVEQGIETDFEWVDNVANRKTVKVLQELLEEREEK